MELLLSHSTLHHPLLLPSDILFLSKRRQCTVVTPLGLQVSMGSGDHLHTLYKYLPKPLSNHYYSNRTLLISAVVVPSR
ncbi:hypothetical protein EVAR_41218_1 [Eumeta japonica]|uniref:Uncharacterized protein n=1 Tax=Eumeta variegata TaxID=151549 RepID=A0A4C1W745_EUMVA|nr:hypothetical protein EVAR_41218_1 [Eumeta japonica]